MGLAQHPFSSPQYSHAATEWEQWALMINDCNSEAGEDSEAAGDS